MLKFLQRALAIVLVIVAHTFLLNVPHPPSTALGFAYGASGVCLVIAAWLLWSKTMD